MGGEGKVETPSDFSEFQLDVLPCPDQSVLTEVTFFLDWKRVDKNYMLYLAPFWYVLALSVVLTLCKYHAVFAQFLYDFMKLGFTEEMFQLE